MSRTAIGILIATGLLIATMVVVTDCGGRAVSLPAASMQPVVAPAAVTAVAPQTTCGSGAKLTVHFYDVSQALSALVDLPDGRHVLVDAADTPGRAGCGDLCSEAQTHLLGKLGADLHGPRSICSGSRTSIPITSAARPRYAGSSRS